MVTRLLTKDDIEQFSQVSSTAYIHDAAETEFDETKDIFGTFTDDGILISQIECGFKNNIYGKNSLKCAAVGGVASRPEFRRMGGVRATFKAVFENAINKNCDISILYPFSAEYYRKFGYETVMHYINAACSVKAFEKIQRFNDITIATEAHREEITEVYKKLTYKNNLMFLRENAENICLTPYNSMRFVYFLNNGDDYGYVFITPKRQEKTIHVDEICFSSPKALLLLLGFLRTYDGNYDTIIFEKLPLNTPIFNFLADENKYISKKICKGGAARIFNIESVLLKTDYPQNHGEFTLKITDEEIAANDGVFFVKYGDGECFVERINTDDYDLSLDILAASKIILGREGVSTEELNFIPGVCVKKDCEDFTRAFGKRSTVFYDDF